MNRDLRGERLGKAAEANRSEPLLFMLPDGTFPNTPDIHGRLARVDRFLSNFHKPLQRRMLFTDPSDPFPDTYVIKHGITDQIYILGQERTDADGVDEYERLNVLHVVSSLSSGYVDLVKWKKPDGAAETDMELSGEVVGKFYISLEYQSSSTEQYSDREQSSRMLFYAPANMLEVADELCEFYLYGKTWSIKQVFYDSGFCSGTLIDSGQNIATYHIVNPVNQYDPVSGTWDALTGAELVPFSASLAETEADFGIRTIPVSINEHVIYIKAQSKYTDQFYAGQLIKAPDDSLWRISAVRNNVRSPDLQATMVRVYGT